MIINNHSAIAYNRFIDSEFKTGIEDDGRIFTKALPSYKPVTPGSNRPMISRSPYGYPEDSPHYEALNKQAKQGFRINKMFIDYVAAVFPKACAERALWQEAIERTFIALWRKKGEVIYSDTFFDWRGRVYQMSGEWGSLQNNRLSRAALSSPERYKVTEKAFQYMKAVFQHEGWPTTVEEATKFVEKPQFDGNGAIDWMAIRAALTILEINRDGMTDYLLEQDATCSGFQHMALLMRDISLAKEVNVALSSTSGDLYMLVAEEGNIADLLFEGNKRKERQFAKAIVMLTGYGSGASGIACKYWLDEGGSGEIEEDLFIPDEEVTIFLGNKEFTYAELKTFVKERQELLLSKFPSIKILRNRCIDYYSECMNADPSAFIWTTPDGFQAVRLISTTEQEANMVGAAGAMPNLIHSLDAAIVRYVIIHWNKVLGVVHDAFFTTINDALELRELVKEAYRNVHENLGEFPIQETGNLPEIGRCIGV